MKTVTLKDIIVALQRTGKEYHDFVKELKSNVEVIDLNVENYTFKVESKMNKNILMLFLNYRKSLLQSIYCRVTNYKDHIEEIPFATFENNQLVFLYNTHKIVLKNKEFVQLLSKKLLSSTFAKNIKCQSIYSFTKLDNEGTRLKLEINTNGFLASFCSGQLDNNYFDYVYYDLAKNQLRTLGNMWTTTVEDLEFLLENTLFLIEDFPLYHQKIFNQTDSDIKNLMISDEKIEESENTYNITFNNRFMTLTRAK